MLSMFRQEQIFVCIAPFEVQVSRRSNDGNNSFGHSRWISESVSVHYHKTIHLFIIPPIHNSFKKKKKNKNIKMQ